MNVLVIGGGGREHAMVWRLRQSPSVKQLYAAPGNPGIAELAECLKPPSPTPETYLAIAEKTAADLTVVGPELPLVAGTADLFQSRGRRIIGPTAKAAQLEGSKIFAKRFMERAGIPTARFETAENANEAAERLRRFEYPVVLKADGLAAGKGVVIATDRTQAEEALATLPTGQFVIEEFLTGEEVSFIVLAGETQAIAFPASQDHKAAYDGDTGPNTGGMGAYSDGRILTDAQSRQVMDQVIQPALERMRAEGTPFQGFLYAGLMWTPAGPKVLEFNVRLGDPEAQALLYRMDGDFAAMLAEGAEPVWKPEPSVCVVLAAAGYPGAVITGDRIEGIEDCGATVFHAGTRVGPGGLETAGGRVLGVTASGADLSAAMENAYAAVSKITFQGMHHRTDIGRKGLKRW